MKRSVVITILLSFSLLLVAQEPVTALKVDNSVINESCLVYITNPDAVIYRDHYSLQYDEKFENSDWVTYELTQDEVMGQTSRKDSFKADPLVKTGSASLADYKASGYDRGHLIPAADLKISKQSMSDSFYMSNMSPQRPSFNRGIWAQLESCVRTWAYENKSIYVVTGPVLTKDEYPTIGQNEVAIPEYYYKVILDYTEPELKAIGFILPNEKATKALQAYAVSVNKVEAFTGLDFYYTLNDDIEETLEDECDVELWPFKQFNQSDFIVEYQSTEENKK
jgi:endonuclease G